MTFSLHTPSLDEMEEMARAEFRALPQEFRNLTRGILFVLADFPDPSTLRQMGIANRYGLLGLFQGAPLARHLANEAGPLPTMISLYRMPILAYAQAQGLELRAVVRHVLIHEIGHHFGFSDDDMEAINSVAE